MSHTAPSAKTIFTTAAALALLIAGQPSRSADPVDTAYLENLAVAVDELRSGSIFSAGQAVNAALQRRRDEPLAYFTQGVLLVHSGAFVDAEKVFDDARALGANPTACAFGKSLCRLGMGDTSGALSVLPSAQGYVSNDEIRVVRIYASILRGQSPSLSSLDSSDDRFSAFAAYLLLGQGKGADAAPLLSRIPAADRTSASLDAGVSLSFDAASPLNVPGSGKDSAKMASRSGLKPFSGFSGFVRLRADRKHTPGAGYVLFYVDDQMIGMVNTAPFEILWDTTRVPNGPHTVRIRGESASGVLIGETSAKVMVYNGVPEKGNPINGHAARKIELALWDLIRPRSSRVWAEYELARMRQSEGNASEALLGYERVLASQPFYRDTAERWKSLARFVSHAPVWRGRGSDRSVALTFDDGPNSGTETLLAALDRQKVSATFFLVGSQARKHPELVKKIVEAGHELACHSESHRSLSNLTESEIIKELFGPISVIHEITGQIPKYFRPPGGHLDGRGRKIADSFGLTPVMWTDNVGPYEGGPARTMEQYVASKTGAGSIVLMHNCEPTTLEALPGIVRSLRGKGLKTVTLSSLAK